LTNEKKHESYFLLHKFLLRKRFRMTFAKRNYLCSIRGMTPAMS
jgi:hypothetical protein